MYTHYSVAKAMMSISTKLGQLKPAQLNDMEQKMLAEFLHVGANKANNYSMSSYILKVREQLLRNGKFRQSEKDWVVSYIDATITSFEADLKEILETKKMSA